ncbi:oxygen-insensitive NADPH nitroreductase [Ammoniphilus sp. CFH 90114]|uniref:oxygen-insensitive NADPH nitroreductase n=1 Tax=Ammoniphilus sp. CFH 90114 TaxID=2493665 RepID=UPI00100FB843|nr:oxygen-insensitive NADPH nitroreductase [Ammoniphilus sp. CFH 90114]RXT15389.1 oxygen-insensitive NADPH nitroreductase [Ammoniphilus sp. CFH 90114]
MNKTIEQLLNHRSIRKFKNQPLNQQQIQLLVKAAQSASTSSHIQAYSIIGVSDQEKKQQLAELAGNQSYVANNAHFFVFCADLYRHEKIGEWKNGEVQDSLESTEKFMVAVIDAALASQNMAVAAESMDLGICYIGGIRNNLPRVQQLLQTPKLVLPLFGLAVGMPEQNPEPKPRLPWEHVYHENSYNDDWNDMQRQLDEYDQLMENYYEERTNGKRKDSWTELMIRMLEGKSRMYMKDFVEEQGFNRK